MLQACAPDLACNSQCRSNRNSSRSLAVNLREVGPILFTGAGFSLDAEATDGEPIPSVGKLKEILWPIAFPRGRVRSGSSNGDIFDCAREANRTLLERNPSAMSDSEQRRSARFLYRLDVGPWRRIYTLNVDDLEEAVQRAHDLPVAIRTVSALTDPIPNHDQSLLCVHLNGTLSDLPDVTFSAPQ